MIAEIRRIWSSIRHVTLRGRLTLIDNKKSIQIQQNELFAGQTKSDIPAPQQYGFESAPLIGADTINLNRGGSLESGWVVMTYDGRYKPLDLGDGDTIMYTKRNVTVPIKAKGTIEYTGVDGTPILKGTLVKRADDFVYVSTEEAVIEEGVASVAFEATIAGELGNAPKDTAVTDVVPNPLATATKIEVMEDGRDVTAHRILLKEENGEIRIETDSTVNVICRDANVDVSNHTTLTTKTADVNVVESATITCPATTWNGNITLNGDITQTGAITSTGDHLAGTISLKNHVHPGDGGTGSGPNTGKPIG